MKKLSVRVKDETWDWIRKGAKERKEREGEFLDYAAARGLRLSEEGKESESSGTGEVRVIGEELELKNGLLRITRDTDGDPIGWARVRTTRPDGSEEPWTEVDWKKLEALNVEMQGLKRDKLAHEVELQKKRQEKLVKEIEKLAISNTRSRNRLPVGARNELEMGKDVASEGSGFPKWCLTCKVTVDTPEELEKHKTANCRVRDLDSGELWTGHDGRGGVVWKGSHFGG
jgi:hypothetical protein